MLAVQLLAGVFNGGFGFSGKADQYLPVALALPHGLGHVRRRHKGERQRAVALLFQLLRGDLLRPIIRRSGGLNDNILLGRKRQHAL